MNSFRGGRFPLPDGYDADQHSQRDVSEFLSSLLHHVDKCVSRSLAASTDIERWQHPYYSHYMLYYTRSFFLSLSRS